MKKVIAVAAVIGLAVGLTWAAEQAGGWLGFTRQGAASAGNQSAEDEDAVPGNEGGLPSNAAATEAGAQAEGGAPVPLALSEQAASIEEDLARIEKALETEEVLEEFIPSEPLSADNDVPWPTDI